MVIVLFLIEVVKLFVEDICLDIGLEVEKMQYVNIVNDFVVKFICLDIDEGLDVDMLVMECFYFLDFWVYEFECCELWFDLFEEEFVILYKVGFVYWDIQCLFDMLGM